MSSRLVSSQLSYGPCSPSILHVTLISNAIYKQFLDVIHAANAYKSFATSLQQKKHSLSRVQAKAGGIFSFFGF